MAISSQLIFVSVFACISAFLFGYDLGSIGPALPLIKESLATTDAVDEVIVGVAKLGAVVGAILGAILMKYGRKPAMLCDVLFFLTGPVVMVVYAHVVLLIIGRFLLGVGIGLSAVVVPAYLGEVSPAKYRGRVVGSYELMLCLGFLSASLVDALLDSLGASWLWMVGLPLAPAVVMAVFVWKVPESPRWLVSEGRLDEAMTVIKEIHGGNGDANVIAAVEGELLDMWSSVQKELAAKASVELADVGLNTAENDHGELDDSDVKHDSSNIQSTQNQDEAPLLAPGAGSCSEEPTIVRPQRKLTLFQSAYRLSRGSERRAFWTVMALAFFNQGCASTAILNYAPVVLESLGVASAMASLFSAATGLSKLLGVTISFLLVDRIGRRPLLMFGSAGSSLSLLVVALADATTSVGLLVLSMSLFIFFFSLSWAEIFWIILSEVFSMKAKSVAIAICTATLFLVGSVADMLFLTLRNAIGFGSFIVYSVVALFGGAFVYYFVPETSRRSLAEVQASFASGRPR
jgi:MFS family permease